MHLMILIMIALLIDVYIGSGGDFSEGRDEMRCGHVDKKSAKKGLNGYLGW